MNTSGVVTAVAAGLAVISATSEGKSGTSQIAVLAPVASLTVTPASASLLVAAAAPLTATLRDASGDTLSGRTTTWATSNPGIATVSTSGVVTGVVPGGPVAITATSEGQSGTAQITVLAPVASVTLAPATASIVVAATAPLTATLKDASGNTLTGRPVTWTTSNAVLATVSSSGVVTGVAPGGPVTITATSEGQSASAVVSVRAAIASVAVTPSSATLVVGESVSLTATPKDAAGDALTGREVSWSTGSASVATVSTSGVVTAIAPGTISIAAASEGKSGAATVTVLPVPVASVVVTPGAVSVVAGSTAILTATPRDASGNALPGRSVAWASSSGRIAAVSPSGVVTAVAEGRATITATAEGKRGQATITVTPPPVATVSVLPGSVVMTVGQAIGLAATPRDALGNPLGNRTISWATSNEGVATVSATGTVTSVGAGTATITATSEGVSGSAAVAVAGSFSSQAVLSNELVFTGSPITYSVDFGFGFSAISAVEFHFVFGADPLDPEECLMWRGGFCNPFADPQTSRSLGIECSGDPGTCELFRDGVDIRQITAERFSGSGVVSVRITSLVITVIGTPLPPR